jgi:hypothetical protein
MQIHCNSTVIHRFLMVLRFKQKLLKTPLFNLFVFSAEPNTQKEH